MTVPQKAKYPVVHPLPPLDLVIKSVRFSDLFIIAGFGLGAFVVNWFGCNNSSSLIIIELLLLIYYFISYYSFLINFLIHLSLFYSKKVITCC